MQISYSSEGPGLPHDNIGEPDAPTEVVLDITDIRFKKVVTSKPEYTIENVSPGRFIVRKGTSVYYVSFEKSRTSSLFASCNCPDWNFHARKLMIPCKHIWLVAEQEGLVTFPTPELLPSDPPDDKGKKHENKKGNDVPLKDG